MSKWSLANLSPLTHKESESLHGHGLSDYVVIFDTIANHFKGDRLFKALCKKATDDPLIAMALDTMTASDTDERMCTVLAFAVAHQRPTST